MSYAKRIQVTPSSEILRMSQAGDESSSDSATLPLDLSSTQPVIDLPPPSLLPSTTTTTAAVCCAHPPPAEAAHAAAKKRKAQFISLESDSSLSSDSDPTTSDDDFIAEEDDEDDVQDDVVSLSYYPKLDRLFAGAKQASDKLSKRVRLMQRDRHGFFLNAAWFALMPANPGEQHCRHMAIGRGICDYCRMRQMDLLHEAVSLREARRDLDAQTQPGA